jgi:membrane-bound ClpP family serine protease
LSAILLHPVVEMLLAAIIFLSILAEIKTAGFSGMGLVAVAAGLLLLAGHWMQGEVSLSEMILLFGGILLVFLDLFLLMSGAAAVGGLVAIAVGLYFLFGSNASALYILSAAIVISIVGLYLIAGMLPESRLWKKVTLSTSNKGYSPSLQDMSRFMGKEGVAESVLRPAGRVRLGKDVVDAVSRGTFIEPGEKVRVVEVSASSVVVEPITHSK